MAKRTAYADLVQQEIDLLDLNSRVIFLRDGPFDELPSIYQMADIFIYPSEYEGFGIPVSLKTLYSGVPVVAAKGSCLEEAGEPSAATTGTPGCIPSLSAITARSGENLRCPCQLSRMRGQVTVLPTLTVTLAVPNRAAEPSIITAQATSVFRDRRDAFSVT